MNWDGLAAAIAALGVVITSIVLPVLSSKLKRKEKEWELRLTERLNRNDKERDCENARLNEIYAKIYGYLWKLLFQIDADRVYIIQPHPLSDKQFISISMEIVHPDRDVTAYRELFQFQKMSDWAGFVADISENDWLAYEDITKIKVRKLYNEAIRRGIKTILIVKLENEKGSWIGNLCAEYTHAKPLDIEMIKSRMIEKAQSIEYILPEYKPTQPINNE